MGRSWGEAGRDLRLRRGFDPVVQIEERVKANGSLLPGRSSVQRGAAAPTARPAEIREVHFRGQHLGSKVSLFSSSRPEGTTLSAFPT